MRRGQPAGSEPKLVTTDLTAAATAASTAWARRARRAVSAEQSIPYDEIRGVARQGTCALRLRCETREVVLRLPNRGLRSRLAMLLQEVAECREVASTETAREAEGGTDFAAAVAVLAVPAVAAAPTGTIVQVELCTD